MRPRLPTSAPASVMPGDVLDSWKEIARYLSRDIRTIQRWERTKGLPVHRLPGGEKPAVYALKKEVDAWRQRDARTLVSTETIPRPRHRFPVPVQRLRASVRDLVSGRGLALPWILAAAIVLGAVAAGIVLHRGKQGFTQADQILIADFVNTTDDPVFDGTLRQALAVQLEQSPYLQIVSEDRVARTLGFMGRRPDERITSSIGREICEREGIKAMLSGSIAPLGRHYAITLQAVGIRSGDTLAREQVEAEDKERVLQALGKAASRIRARLGESLPSIQKLDLPQEQATTPSLEALRWYALAFETRQKSGSAEAIPFYQKAIGLDPDFALAHARLGVAYRNLGELGQAGAHLRKAFTLRERISEHERFIVESTYYQFVTGEIEKAIEVLEMYKRTFPQDQTLRVYLGVAYSTLGQLERALAETREALRLDSGRPLPHSNLAGILVHLNRYDEARAVCENALARKLDYYMLHVVLFQTAVMQADEAGMARQVEWASGTPYEHVFANLQAEHAERSGRFTEARKYRRLAVEGALKRKLTESASRYLSQEALTEAFCENCREARERAKEALILYPDRGPMPAATVALAVCGEQNVAESLLKELQNRFPADTLYAGLHFPTIQAAIQLRAGHPEKALEVLRAAAGFEQISPIPAHLRGLAYLGCGRAAEAAAEFQKVIQYPGPLVGPGGPYSVVTASVLAYLGRARAAAIAGDRARSRKAYDEFFSLWKDADPDIPVLRAARNEYRAARF